MATLPLDPSIYNLDEEERSFFKAQTGIQDDDELRDHILEVQAEAYAVSQLWKDLPSLLENSYAGLSISLYQTFGFYCVSSLSDVHPKLFAHLVQMQDLQISCLRGHPQVRQRKEGGSPARFRLLPYVSYFCFQKTTPNQCCSRE